MPRFDRDPAKVMRNLSKHGVAFDDATLVWADPHYILRFDRYEDGEERWHAIGSACGVVVLLVVHTEPEDDTIRIVGARRATRHERRIYQDGEH